jgi:transposase
MDDEAITERVLPRAHMRAHEVVGEVLSGPERRRRWSTEEKLHILAQSVAPGSSPALTRRLHGISSGQLYTWRKQFRRGELTGFVPVSIAPELMTLPAPEPAAEPPPSDPPTRPCAAEPAAGGAVEVELPSGVKLRFTGDVEEIALRRILSALS